ncbi:MAG: methyltransferase domain-containing protein [Rhodospirillales bacterium]|nr:methyltransferase domain-containing protein [Rhodospirillales bacterium]
MSRDDIGNEATPTYTMGYGPEFRKMLERRNAADCARHLLPQLKPGMRLIDLGCGPGTISVGLADAVAPGQLLGIDMEPTQIEMASAAAQAGGHGNAAFQTGDATDLPFDDATFDVAYCHALLNHAPDTQAVLGEVKRVLKPGGLFAAREVIGDSSLIEPALTFGGVGEGAGWATFLKLLAANGGHPQMGKELKAAFVEAGFADVRATASFESYDTADDLAFLHGLVNGWFFAPKTMGAAIGLGLASEEQFEGWRRSLDEWVDESGAFAAFAWGEAIGRKL